MLTLDGTIFMLMVAILIGKKTRRYTLFSYFLIVLIALIEVGLVLYDMYTMPMPKI
ncbi:MAG TPA: hypothetical protein VES59_00080 [Bacteroidota bacterium]|nr:hypothetical protein [Bacteroidota bacterium]